MAYSNNHSTLYESQVSLLNEKLIRIQPGRATYIWGWIFQAVLFVISSTFLILSRSQYEDPKYCTEKFASYSPALEAYDDTSYEYTRFDEEYWKDPLFDEPSPEVDAEWERLTLLPGGLITMSESEWKAINATQPGAKLSDAYDGRYIGMIDGLHQIHCLNVLRRVGYPEYYRTRDPSWKISEAAFRGHVKHCLSIIKQKIMCDADASVISYSWIKNELAPFPNFGVAHKCRNYNKLVQWATERQLLSVNGEINPATDAVILDKRPIIPPE